MCENSPWLALQDEKPGAVFLFVFPSECKEKRGGGRIPAQNINDDAH